MNLIKFDYCLEELDTIRACNAGLTFCNLFTSSCFIAACPPFGLVYFGATLAQHISIAKSLNSIETKIGR